MEKRTQASKKVQEDVEDCLKANDYDGIQLRIAIFDKLT